MKTEKILLKLINGSKNIKFDDIVKLLYAYGFTLERINGSHHIFKKESIKRIINIQNVKGEVKPYQLNQLLNIIEKYDLQIED